ncbi:hypothetical protein CY35_07G008400 [Sphagnum magellanicum]|uniref:Uncharacterized protein n=1 Tax=Sphagnum magellanicum TaxID=128215 RepID=A0ACB8HIS8_9BRYO|nr:hypothetical protein CY35_07G008400 [Sphagnum magellanicum]
MAGSQLAAATLVAHSHTIVLLGVLIIIIQLFMGVLCQPVNCTGRTNPADVAALQQLYVEWNETYDLQTTLRGWQNDVDPCYDGAWFGVLCDFSTCPTYKVIGLELTGLDLQGQLSHAIGNLTNLQFLTISGNPRLSGNLPNEISNLNNLLKLDLHGNNFTGHIPNFQMEFLQHLDLSGNALSGQIADIFNSILGGQNTKKLSLQILDLSSNHLNGIMPKMPPAISQLNISHNQLDGTLDAFLGSLTNISGITTLDISYNNFSGNVSSLFHNLNVGLSVLLMNNNNFNGDFPDLSSTLQILDISNNKFDGSFPTFNTSNCSLSLKYVSMAGNMFAGPLPYELLHCSPMLEVINFNQNNFSGILNVTNINTSHLVGEISLANNSIVGLIPPWESGTYSPVLLGGNPCCNTSQIVTEDDYLLDEVEIFYVNGSLESLLQAYNCRYNLSTITIPGLTNFSPFRPTNDNKVLIWTLSTTLPFFMIMGSIILTITFWKYRANMIILREIQQEFANKEVQPTLYSYNTLKTAARDFHQSNKLGEGGFGIVYKGVLSNGGELAIKLLKKSEQGVTEFLNEIVLLTSVKHKNLVTLKGCCLHGVQRLLVYEFVENQNLAEVLWGDNYLQLDWPRRFNICVGIARGLSYLHEDSHQRIIHRDIKAPNILLDKQFNAKIADFGLARLFPDDETHMTTFHIAGTRHGFCTKTRCCKI